MDITELRESCLARDMTLEKYVREFERGLGIEGAVA